MLRLISVVMLLSAALGCSEPQPSAARSEPKPTQRPVADDAGSHRADAELPPLAAGSAAPLPAPAILQLTDDERCPFGCEAQPSPLEQPSVTQEHAPPALSGGTLLTTRDAKWLIAADPDRDRLYFVDLERGELSHTRELSSGAEPGRLVEDDSGRIHVALRGSGELLTLTRAPDSQMTERSLCAHPRGLAYDAATKEVHMACAGGALISIAAEPSTKVFRKLDLERDLRDVLVRGPELLVTRFRSAEVLRIGSDGNVVGRVVPPTFVLREFAPTGMFLPGTDQAPTVAWRAIDIPGKGGALLHQRARVGPVQTHAGGYASLQCNGILQSAVTIGLDGERMLSADLHNVALPVDIAASPDAKLLAVVSASSGGFDPQLRVFALTGTSPLNPDAPSKPLSQNLGTRLPETDDPDKPAQVCIAARTQFPMPPGQLTSVSFTGDRKVAVFSREPAAISVIDLLDGRVSLHIDLDQESRRDTGYDLFHMRTPAGVACASCHAEAGDDSHVWTFANIGPRRTQALRGGILGTEPYHWDGDMADFDALVGDVFVNRMSVHQEVPKDKRKALATWLDAQPGLRADGSDQDEVQRGKALFESSAVGCASCHSGPLLTNNQRVDVGTGAAFQVPALRGVSFRLPVMHDGCAETLKQRFDAACGGDAHGATEQLSSAELDDLIAYLNTL
jgi:mono/diheme cytochrome c family protein